MHADGKIRHCILFKKYDMSAWRMEIEGGGKLWVKKRGAWFIQRFTVQLKILGIQIQGMCATLMCILLLLFFLHFAFYSSSFEFSWRQVRGNAYYIWPFIGAYIFFSKLFDWFSFDFLMKWIRFTFCYKRKQKFSKILF